MAAGAEHRVTSLPKQGDRIVLMVEHVADPDDGTVRPWLVRVRVRRVARGYIMHTGSTTSVRGRDAGRTWAKGWDGEAADALRAQVRLQGGRVDG
jgi:hypothetical protein